MGRQPRLFTDSRFHWLLLALIGSHGLLPSWMSEREKKEHIGSEIGEGEGDSISSVIILGIPNMIIAGSHPLVGDAVYSNSSRQMCTMPVVFLVFSLLLLISILQGATKVLTLGRC